MDRAAAVNTFLLSLIVMCCFEWMPKGQGHGDVSALTPARTLTPFTTQHGKCEKRGEDGEERRSEREREAAFVTAETTVFVPQHHGGTRATNVKQTKARGTSMLDTHTRTHTHMHTLIDFLLGRHGNKKVIVGSCLCWKRMETANL